MKNARQPERPVQPVLRALGLIEALNRKPVSALEDLAGATGLPKPTVVRLMQTLIAGGYAERLPRRRGYAPAERVRRLAEGFRDADAVVAAARPLLSAFTAEHQWPVVLATFDHGAMRVRLSTRQESPFATDDDQISRRVPMLISAVGRAYLAFCPSAERETILALLRASPRAANRPAHDRRHVAALLRSIRRAGYASTGPVPGDRATGLAVPITQGSRVLGAMSLRYLGAALSEAEAVRRYLRPLQRTARAIAEAAAVAGD
jgi:IclR family transcriptional regulator, mhp operon transcriptional activator